MRVLLCKESCLGGGDPIVKLLDKVYYTVIVKGKKRIQIVVRIKLSLIEQREIDE